jgi:hypothetical protein
MLRWAKGLLATSVVSGLTSFTDLPGTALLTKVLVCISASLYLLYLAGGPHAPFGMKHPRKLYR